jgi:hypothetical protein
MGEGEMREILSVKPRGTSRVLLHAGPRFLRACSATDKKKSYDMGPSRFTSHPRGRRAADFYRP